MKHFATALIFASALTATALAQDVRQVVDGAYARTQEYKVSFADLLADERKTFEEFNKDGKVKDSKTVLSSFLVYRSGKNSSKTAELRNVREVDGRAIPDSQKRGENFLAELEKAETFETELKKLEKQSAKYDDTWIIYGLTLNQAVVLSPKLRDSFRFELTAPEAIDGVDCLVVDYVQIAPNPLITVNQKPQGTGGDGMNFDLEVPRQLRSSGFSVKGRIWIEKDSLRIRRERQTLAARAADPVVLLDADFDYAPGEFGFLVPSKIDVVIYDARRENGDRYSSLRRSRAAFTYSNFRRTNVEVRILDDEPK